jgi:hypothetical protein
MHGTRLCLNGVVNAVNLNIRVPFFSFKVFQMKNVFSSGIKAIASILLAVCMIDAGAQTTTQSVSITKIRTGWAGDVFTLETAGFPILNPAGCTLPDGYLADISSAGYKTHLAAALTAFSTDKKVTIIISDHDCVLSRPKIWGIYIEK